MGQATFQDWFSLPTEELAGAAVATLSNRRASLALAESCTGGLVAAAITSIPGSSAVFGLGLVTYSNAAKTRLLGVPKELIAAHGAVSAECVRAMAHGAMNLAGADAAVAVSGIAGPDGGSTEMPVGTVWFGVACGRGLGESVRERVTGIAGGTGRHIRAASVRGSAAGAENSEAVTVELAAVCIQFDGDRESIRAQASKAALALLMLAIGEQGSS